MWGVSAALITMLAIALISHYAKGIWQILPFLLGTLIGYVYAIILTVTGIYKIVDFSVFANLKLFNIPDFAFLNVVDDYKIFVVARDDAKDILKNKDNKNYQWLIKYATSLINQEEIKKA